MKKKHKKDKLSKRSIWATCLILYIAALTIRLVYLSEIQSLPSFFMPAMDELYHVQLADQINSAEGLPDQPYFRAPLYPYLLAFFMKVSGGSLYWPRVFQILIGSLLPVLLFLLGRKLFSYKIALVSAAIAVFYPTFIYFDSSLLITSTIVLFSVIVVLQLYRTQEKPESSNFIISGLLLGIAGLARPNILLLGPALIIWIWIIIRPRIGVRKAMLCYLLMGLASILVILPVTIRNYAVSKDFVFISWQGGTNFYLGNNIDATGWSATAPGIDPSWSGGYDQMISIARVNEGRDLKLSEVSDFWYAKALDDITASPGHFIKLTLKKIRFLVNGYEIPNNQNIYMARWFAPVIKPLLFNKIIFFPYGVIIPLSIIGIILSIKERRKFLLLYLFLGAYTVSLLLFFVCARFRQPLIPFLILFAVYGCFELVRLFKYRHFKFAVFLLVILLLLFYESNHFILNAAPARIEAESHYFVGSRYLAEFKAKYGPQSPIPPGDLPPSIVHAIEQFKKAAEVDSTFAMSFNDLGTIAMRRNRYDEARRYLEKAIAANPVTRQPYINYARILSESNDYKSAINVLERAERLFPYDPVVSLNLGYAYYQSGDLTKAEDALSKCLQVNPRESRARMLLEQISRLKKTSTGIK